MMLVNIQQAARGMGVSPHTIRAWLYQGKLSYVKLGRRVLLRSEDLEAFIKKNVVEAKK